MPAQRTRAIRASSVVLCVLVGGVVGLGLFTFHYAKGGSYFSSDPTSCVNCHIMREQYDSWQKASHHAHATCVDCHLPHDFLGKYWVKAENGFMHSKAFTLQDFHEPIRARPSSARVVNDACIDCHQALVGDVVGHGGLGQEKLSCVHCHPAAGHGAPR